MLIADTQRTARAELLLDFETSLLGIGILHVPVHGGEVDQHLRRQGGEDIGECRSSGLRGRQAYADLAGASEVRRVSAREQRIGQGAERDAVIEQSEAAANDGSPRIEWRPGESGARRDVVRIGVNGFQELQIVADAQVESQTGADFPFVLCVESDVWIRLRNEGVAEGLGISGAVVDALQEVRKRGKRVAASNGSRESDGDIVVKEINAHPEGMCSHLARKVVHDFVEVVDAAGRRTGERTERSDA